MADAVTSQTIYDGERNAVFKFTNVSDGTGEAAVLKVDPTTLQNSPGTRLKIARIKYDVKAGQVELLWKATANVMIEVLGGFAEHDYRRFGGLVNNAGAGATGGIVFTTVGFANNSSYTVILELIKGWST